MYHWVAVQPYIKVTLIMMKDLLQGQAQVVIELEVLSILLEVDGVHKEIVEDVTEDTLGEQRVYEEIVVILIMIKVIM